MNIMYGTKFLLPKNIIVQLCPPSDLTLYCQFYEFIRVLKDFII